MTPQQIEAMKMALEALEDALNKPMWDRPKMTEAITAIEEALAQPERHELQAKGEHPAPCARHCEANAFKIVIKNLKAQLAQPEQKPVAWFSPSGNLYKTRFHATANGEQVVTHLYTAPPQRTWVWLTKVERIELLESTHPNNRWSLLALCEAKLKEKNT